MVSTISIVIPVLNEEKALPDCLSSLRNQDFPNNYEILVVDNGSWDRSVKVARQFGARVVFSPTLRNVFAARSYGASAAGGQVVVQADADTIYPPDWLGRIAKHFDEHPEVVAVAGTFTYRHHARWEKAEYWSRNFVNRLTMKVFHRPFLPSGANLAFLKQAFEQAGGYNMKLYSPDQYGIITQLSKTGKIVYDQSLSVATSPRRNDKPAYLMALAVIRNVFQGCATLASEALTKLFSPEHHKSKARSHRPRTLLVALLIVIAVTFAGIGYFLPSSQVFGKVYYCARTSDKVIALTLDDSPNEPYTSQILDTLDANGIKATFFCTGKNVELYPDVAERIVSEGHVLGNHSYSHNANHALTEEGIRDIAPAQAAIFITVGVLPHLYRPPHGKKSPWELQYLRSQNMVEITWNISTNELHTKSAEKIAEAIISKAKPGGIILLHDGYGNLHDSHKADKSLTVEVLPIIIDKLQEEGYRFVTIPELLGIPAYNN